MAGRLATRYVNRMNGFDAGRRWILAGAAAVALGGCMRLGNGAPVRRMVLRLPVVSRHVFWEKIQKYASENGLACTRVPPRPVTPRSFEFLLRGRGLDIIGRNNAYDPLQPDDYAIVFYGSTVFGAPRETIDRFADTFRDTMLSENSIKLISDSGARKSPPK